MGRAVNEAVVIALLAVFAFNYVFTQTLLATHPEISVIKVMPGWLAVPRDWLGSLGDIARFGGRVMGERLLGPGAALLRRGAAPGRDPDPRLGDGDLGPGLHPRPPVRDRGRVLQPQRRAPRRTPASFAAWCDLREVIPYAFGYMMAAKVGTGIVAELGAMRISDEVDALEVMGVNPMIFLCATRLLGAWMTLPVHLPGRDRGRLPRLLHRRRRADRRGLLGRLLPDLLDVPEPARPPIQPDQGDVHGDGDRAGRLLLRLHRLRRAGRRRHGDREVDGPQHRLGAHHRDDGDTASSGARTRAPRSEDEVDDASR